MAPVPQKPRQPAAGRVLRLLHPLCGCKPREWEQLPREASGSPSAPHVPGRALLNFILRTTSQALRWAILK